MDIKSRFIRSNSQRGFTLGEFALVLGIAIFILSFALPKFTEMRRGTSVKEASEAVTTILANLRSHFGVNNLYGQISTANAIASGAIPEHMVITGTSTAQNQWGGLVTVAPLTLTATNDASGLTLTQVPSNQCYALVIGSHEGTRRVQVAGTAVKPTDAALNLTTLRTQCASAASVSIEWAVGKA